MSKQELEHQKSTVLMDFDGVIHSYKSGWQGIDVIPDPPVEGIREAIQELRQKYNVVVYSTRCAKMSGIEAIKVWLFNHDIDVDDVSAKKVPAIVTIDDRAVAFDGNAAKLPRLVEEFRPWYEPRRSEVKLSYRQTHVDKVLSEAAYLSARTREDRQEDYINIRFQEGPIVENGVNGCQIEDVIDLLVQRLRSFQEGPYACRENALAITKLEEAQMWLEHRTYLRRLQGVEGINKPHQS